MTPELNPSISLRDFQQEAIESNAALIVLPTGAGKTLLSQHYFASKSPIKKAIVVTDASLLLQFESAAKFFYGDGLNIIQTFRLSPTVRRQKYLQFQKATSDSYTILLLSWEVLRSFKSSDWVYFRGHDFVTILDEFSRCSNSETKTYRAVKDLNNLAVSSLGLTATTKSPLKITTMLNALGRYPLSLYEVKRSFCLYSKQRVRVRGGQIKTVSTLTGFKNIEQFNSIVAPHTFVRNKGDIAKSIPPFVSHIYNIPKDSIIDKSKKVMLDTVENVSVASALLSSTMPQYFIKDAKNPKFNFILDLINKILDESDTKILVYAEYKPLALAFSDFLNSAGVSTTVITSEQRADKQAIIDSFVATRSAKVLVATSAIAHGVDGLQKVAKDLIFLLTPAGNVETYQQVCGRLSRLGGIATSGINIHLPFIEDTLEFDTYRSIVSQLKLIRSLNNTVDEGLIPPELDVSDIQDSGIWLKQRLTSFSQYRKSKKN